MTAPERAESPPDAPYFCGVPYPSAEAAVAARNGMKHPPKGLRVKRCEECKQYHLRARNNLHGRHRGRSLRLPAGPGRASTIALTYRPGPVGMGGTPSPLAGGAGDGVPVNGQNGTNRSTREMTQ